MDYSKLAQAGLPFEGEFFFARNKKYEDLIFFVHFYEGKKRQLLRHIKLVNELGFDAFAFHLQGTHRNLLSWRPPLSKHKDFGIKHVYADQIEFMLNKIPGKKIIFSFSNPSSSAIEALARRQCMDISALICDSGPSARFLDSALSLASHEYSIQLRPLKWSLIPVISLGWSLCLHKDVHQHLNIFPAGFKILSIRGWRDKLIAPNHIDEIFEPHHQLDWTKLSLPEAEHLAGLRDFKEEYRPAVEKFLSGVGHPLK
jgi:hypothetical protein